jgi:hypothetical protein
MNLLPNLLLRCVAGSSQQGQNTAGDTQFDHAD